VKIIAGVVGEPRWWGVGVNFFPKNGFDISGGASIVAGGSDAPPGR
jgi:hypothetical protein